MVVIFLQGKSKQCRTKFGIRHTHAHNTQRHTHGTYTHTHTHTESETSHPFLSNRITRNCCRRDRKRKSIGPAEIVCSNFEFCCLFSSNGIRHSFFFPFSEQQQLRKCVCLLCVLLHAWAFECIFCFVWAIEKKLGYWYLVNILSCRI